MYNLKIKILTNLINNFTDVAGCMCYNVIIKNYLNYDKTV